MNSPAAVEWSAALAFLALGLGLGAALVWRVVTSRAKGTAPGVPLDLRDLAGKRDALVLQLARQRLHGGREPLGPRPSTGLRDPSVARAREAGKRGG